MLNLEMVFITGMLTAVGAGAGYAAGVVSQRIMALFGVPAICSALAATIAIGMAPPPPPLSPAEKARQKAQDDGYMLGLATGMLFPR